MAKIIPISEHFQHFLAEVKESFWGDLYGQTKLAWQRFFELQSERERDRYSGAGHYERRRGRRKVYRNGYYERDFVIRFGTIRLRIARTRAPVTQRSGVTAGSIPVFPVFTRCLQNPATPNQGTR